MNDLSALTAQLGGGLAVFSYYVKDIKIGGKILSPLRDEKDPSFSVYFHEGKGCYYFKDHGADLYGDCYRFVMHLFGLEFREAIEKIRQDVLGEVGGARTQEIYSPPLISKREVKLKSRVELIPTYRDWRSSDIAYFNQYLISIPYLEKFHIRPASSYVYKKETLSFTIYESPSDPIYVIDFGSGNRKIYRPLAKNAKFKWTSNIDASVDIFGYDLLPESGPVCFITAGNKDTVCFAQNIGLPDIPLNSETARMPEWLQIDLSSRFERIYSLGNNDATGERMTNRLLELGIQPANEIIIKEGVNDFADLIKKYRADEKALSEIRSFFLSF